MERRIEVEGCHNFRDLGGYPTRDGGRVRWRRLFRADALHRLTPRGVETLRGELGIGQIVDLRSTGELETDGRGLLEREAVRFRHLPLFDGALSGGAAHRAQAHTLTLADRYFLLAEYAKEPIAAVIGALAESDAPSVYHCAAGKDRTGVISAILLGILDVRDEVIVADYAATQENLDEIIERLMENAGYQEMFEVLPPDTLHAEPDTMISLLERLREHYGGVAEYARASGVSDAQVKSLRERLLE